MNKAAAAHSANEASEVRQARRRSPRRNERSSSRLGAEEFRNVIRLLSDGSELGLKTGVWPAVGAVLNSIAIDDLLREHNFLKNISDVAKAAKVETFSAKFKKRTCELTHSIN